MRDEDKSAIEAEVRLVVTSCADEAGVLARCRPPRRRSDVTTAFLRGSRQAVLGLPLRIFDELEGYDIEIIRSSNQEDRYLLVLAVTETLDAQSTRTPERRAKLRRRLERAEGE